MFESPYTGHDFVQFGKTKSVLNKRAQELALLFNPPSVLSLEIILYQTVNCNGQLITIHSFSSCLHVFIDNIPKN